jgi:hypothetical protein
MAFSFCQEGTMIRERVLKVVLVVVGLLFVAMAYPLLTMRLDEALQMMMSVYITLGIFLLLAARKPSAYRSVIAFAAWSSFAHAAVMVVQAYYDVPERVHFLVGVIAMVIIGVALIALSPAKFRIAEA